MVLTSIAKSALNLSYFPSHFSSLPPEPTLKILLKGRTLGADDYLTKPISRDELVTTIRSRLNRSHQVKLAQIEQAYVASMTLLAGAIEARTLISNNHIERVTETCLLLASYLGWSERSMPRITVRCNLA